MNDLPKHLQFAIEVAEANDTYLGGRGWRLGAVLVRSSNRVGIGQSRLRCDPILHDTENLSPQIRRRLSLHAEEDALRRCGSTKNAVAYVARVTRGGKVALARPCSRCVEALSAAGIKRVIYTINPSEYGTLSLRSR